MVRQVQRTKIILLAAEGLNNMQISKQARSGQDSISKWWSRFIKSLPLLQEIAEKAPSSLEKAVAFFLDDSPRPGQPPHYTNEQIIRILETACCNPVEPVYEASHWSLNLLADAVYIRHGTTSLTGFFDVATGRKEIPYLNPTRTETDFVEAMRALIETDPGASWTFVCDGLNTHKSESLVRFVAEQCDLTEDPGRKRKSVYQLYFVATALFEIYNSILFLSDDIVIIIRIDSKHISNFFCFYIIY